MVDISRLQVYSQLPIVGLPGEGSISLAPFGSIYVTGQYLLIEYAGQPPFDKMNQTSVFTSPGKLAFSPDGRYGLAPNNLLNGSSILTFDFQVRGSIRLPGPNQCRPHYHLATTSPESGRLLPHQ